jgi:hypothetical protein
MGVDLEDRVDGIFGAGDVVAPGPDDLRTRREEPLRRRCRHGRGSCDFLGPRSGGDDFRFFFRDRTNEFLFAGIDEPIRPFSFCSEEVCILRSRLDRYWALQPFYVSKYEPISIIDLPKKVNNYFLFIQNIFLVR